METKVHSSHKKGLCEVAQKGRKMNRKEEKLNAVQNIGAATFMIGVIGGCMSGNPITLMVCIGSMAVGAMIVFIAGLKLDKLEKGVEEHGRTGEKAS